MKHIEVVAAIIVQNGKCFATQRGYGNYKGWWEFPGGKVEEGETREAALAREIKEELDVDICVKRFVRTVEFEYPEFFLTMHCYVCELISGELKLKEHEAARWLDYDSLDSVRWLPADLDVVEEIKNGWHLKQTKGDQFFCL